MAQSLSKPPTIWGTIEYYKESFMDTLADIGDEFDPDDPVDHKMNCLYGLTDALKEWFEYHDKARKRYEGFAQELYDVIQDFQ